MTLVLMVLKLSNSYSKWICLIRSISVEISLFSCSIFLALLNLERKKAFENTKLFETNHKMIKCIIIIWIITFSLGIAVTIEFLMAGDKFTCITIHGGKSQYTAILSKIFGFCVVLISGVYSLPSIYKNAKNVEKIITSYKNQHTNNRINLEQKAFQILIAFTVEFLIFWLPILIVRILQASLKNNINFTMVEEITLIATLLNLFICCVHPITILKLSNINKFSYEFIVRRRFKSSVSNFIDSGNTSNKNNSTTV